MSIEETVYTRLSEYTGLSALVANRIYPNIKAQDATMPCVTYRRVSSIRFSAMGEDAEVVKSRFQVDVWAMTYDEASAVRDQVVSAMQRWKNGTGTVVQDTFIITETDLFETDTRQHHIAIDIEINYIQ